MSKIVNFNSEPLSGTELNEALNAKSIPLKFTQQIRTIEDPKIPDQKIGLFSFVPAKGATANANKCFGFLKLRGNYGNENDASFRARELIKNNDSFHPIYHVEVGWFIPLAENMETMLEDKVDEVNLNKEIKETINESIRRKKREDEQSIKEIEKSVEELKKEEAEGPSQDPLDIYIQQRVKRATLKFQIKTYYDKIKELIPALESCSQIINQKDIDEPELRNSFFEKYSNSLSKIGIDTKDAKFVNNEYYKFISENALNISEIYLLRTFDEAAEYLSKHL